MTALLFAVFCAPGTTASAQNRKLKVFFVGNSFTGTNNLPLVTSEIARSMGDTLEFDSNAPGGYTLQQHSSDATTLSKISMGTWNYVVLQEQSQSPAFPYAQVLIEVYPYAKKLDSLVHDKNICGRSVFYRTWGYPDGDVMNCPSFPPVCSYEGMDSLLNERYSEMAINNNALLSPVGNVFAQILKLSPTANLFQADRMHPSEMGTYAGALTFYTILYRKDPTTVPFTSTLSVSDANLVKDAVRDIVFTSLPKWHVGEYDPKVGFTESISGLDVSFNSSPSMNVSRYRWDFGDGGSSTDANPLHTYATGGFYDVKLYADNCILMDSAKRTIEVVGTGIAELKQQDEFRLYPNPAGAVLHITSAKSVSLDNATISIWNLLGTRVATVDHYAQQAMDISVLPAGMYIVKVATASGGIYTQRFTKK